MAPDGVLSQIEQRLLEAHVERCEACRTFADGVAGIAAMLRTAALEERERTVPFRAPASQRRPRFSYVSGVASAAATIAVTTIAVSTIVAFATNSDRTAPIGRPAVVVDATSVDSDVERSAFLRELRDYSHARTVGEVQNFGSHGPGLFAG